MNPEDQKQNTDNKPKDPPPPPIPEKDKTKEIEHAKESSGAQAPSGNKEKSSCPPVSIVDKIPDKWNKANVISIVAAGINVVVVIAYGLLYSQGQRAAQETKREFETSNRPFIELANVRVDSIGEGQKPVTSYTLSNKGKFPALVTEFRIFTGLAGKDATAETIIQNAERSSPNNMRADIGLIPFSPAIAQQSSSADSTLKRGMIAAINSGDFSFYLLLEIKYYNFNTNTHYHYIAGARIKMTPNIMVTSFKYIDDPDSTKQATEDTF